MRLVTGSVVNGGTVDFTTAFASQTPAGSVSITAVSGSAGATTLTTPQIPSHTHPNGGGNAQYIGGNASPYDPARTIAAQSTGSTGGDGSHTHPFSFSSGSGTFTGTAINLAVKYYDFIIASID
jgi:microcystin-dependent protein